MNVYVGNLSYDLSEEDLKTAFEEYGEVTSAKIISDRYSGRSKGFGFIEMSSDDEAKAAIEGLAGKELAGRAIVVNEARPR